MIPKGNNGGAIWRALLLVVLLACLIGLVIGWHWTSFGSLLDIDELVFELRTAGAKLGVLAALASIALASIVAIPLGIIIVVCSIAFGPALGVLYAVAGASLGGVVSYGIGSYLGHDGLCRFAGPRVNELSVRLGKRGLLAVIAIRMLPLAPFAIVNMVAGATHIRLRDFIIGTLLGMLPGALIIVFLVERIEAALRGSASIPMVLMAAVPV